MVCALQLVHRMIIRFNFFVRTTPSDPWNVEAVLTANDISSTSLARFGLGVSIVSRNSAPNNIAVIGAPGPGGDAAYVFTRNGSTWTQVQKLIPVQSPSVQSFGQAVDLDISGDKLLVGAPDADAGQGEVYTYNRNGMSWNLIKRLVASDGAPGHQFGWSVSVDSSQAIIGAPNYGSSSVPNTGKGYIFSYNSAIPDWTEITNLSATGAQLVARSRNGFSVAIASITNLVMGAPQFGINSQITNVGVAYFSMQQGTSSWIPLTQVQSPDPKTGDVFGTSVAIAEASFDPRPVFLVGSPGKGTQGQGTGAAYLYAINP